MGLIKAALGSVGNVLADQWKEYFYCDSMAANVLVTKGKKRTSSRRRQGRFGHIGHVFAQMRGVIKPIPVIN